MGPSLGGFVVPAFRLLHDVVNVLCDIAPRCLALGNMQLLQRSAKQGACIGIMTAVTFVRLAIGKLVERL